MDLDSIFGLTERFTNFFALQLTKHFGKLSKKYSYKISASAHKQLKFPTSYFATSKTYFWVYGFFWSQQKFSLTFKNKETACNICKCIENRTLDVKQVLQKIF